MNSQIKIILFIIFMSVNSETGAVKFKTVLKLLSVDDVDFSRKSIFFIETAPRGLNHREACSVVSTAKANPNRPINVFFAEAVPTAHLRTQPMLALAKYRNINLYRINLTMFSYETPLQYIVSEGLPISDFPLHHKADILRYLILYKYGGTYSDLDMIMVKSLDTLPQKENWVGRAFNDEVAAGLLSIGKYTVVGQRIINNIVSMMSNEFVPSSWSHNSNGILNKALKKTCNISRGPFPSYCKGFRIYDRDFFYPIPYTSNDYYFKFTGKQWMISAKTYAFHVWNKLTHMKKIHDKSLYAQFARKYCPEYTRRPNRWTKTNATNKMNWRAKKQTR